MWRYKEVCPYHRRYELVDWAISKWPNDKAKFKRMKRVQLYAVWYNDKKKV